MNFKDFLNEMSASRGIVYASDKKKLMFDQHDRDIYDYVIKNIKSANSAGDAVLARYFYLRDDLRQMAEHSRNAYYKDVQENQPGSPGVLVAKTRSRVFQEIPMNTYIGELRHRVKDLIPLFEPWGQLQSVLFLHQNMID